MGQARGAIAASNGIFIGDLHDAVLLAKSDKEFYAARQGGKNRAVFAAGSKVLVLNPGADVSL